MTSYINLHKDKIHNLKKVLPELHLTGWGDIVFSFEGDGREGDTLTIKQSRSGYDGCSPAGLGNFLVEVGAFSQGKSDMLSKQEFRSIEDLYNQAAKFVAQGRAAAEKKVEDRFILSILELPFVDRCIAASEIGYLGVIRVILSSLEKRFSENIFTTLTSNQRAYYIKALGSFRSHDFGQIVLTGDAETDCASILQCF